MTVENDVENTVNSDRTRRKGNRYSAARHVPKVPGNQFSELQAKLRERVGVDVREEV